MSRLIIKGYNDAKTQQSFGSYELQFDAMDLKIGPDSNLGGKANSDNGITEANGVLLNSNPIPKRRKLSFKFIIDTSGATPFLPPGENIEVGTSIQESIDALIKVVQTEVKETHKPPYVHVIWDDINLFGTCEDLVSKYTFHNLKGVPLRAEISITIIEVVDLDGKPLRRSPDMTRMAVVKDKDTLVQFCEKFYKDKNYYLKIADLNNLSSIRSLKIGKQLEFPPIKK